MTDSAGRVKPGDTVVFITRRLSRRLATVLSINGSLVKVEVNRTSYKKWVRYKMMEVGPIKYTRVTRLDRCFPIEGESPDTITIMKPGFF